MSNNFKKIGIFGGSFNPPHLGHLRLAEAIIQKLSLDRMIIIPNKISPYKDSSEYASEADRLAMCRLNFSGSVFEVSTLEFDRRGKSYTYDTLCQIRELYPDAELYLTVGSDMLYYFENGTGTRIYWRCVPCAPPSVTAKQTRSKSSEFRKALKDERCWCLTTLSP